MSALVPRKPKKKKMKRRFAKLTKAEQGKIELEYAQMNPHEFDGAYVSGEDTCSRFDTVASSDGSEFESCG